MIQEYRSEEVLAVMPPSAEDFDFDQMDCVPVGPEVTVVDDFELSLESGCPVLEIVGKDSKMVFFTQSTLPFISFHIKSLDRFITLTLSMMDDTGETREVNFSNKSSLVSVNQNVMNLPISIGDGWQYLCLDLRKLCNHGFGTNFSHCTEVAVGGTCRLSKVFFMARELADVELPAFLRVCQRD